MQANASQRRILIIDDNESIHDDFRKTLVPSPGDTDVSLLADEAAIFGDASPSDALPAVAGQFELDSVFQGQDGLQKVEAAVREGRPYQLAFVDMRMPPGWDGVQTIEQIWRADPHMQIVICTAYSDYSLEQITKRLGDTDRLLILKKPFDDIEVCQLASAMTEKWRVTRQAQLKLSDLESLVEQRTLELQHAALYDQLTGLPNRRLLLDRLARCVARVQRDSQHGFALLFLDFDRFKVVNDSLGHDVGDQMLIEIARRLSTALRDADSIATIGAVRSVDDAATAARHGGDEFIILLEGIQHDHDAARVSERLLQMLSAPYTLAGHLVQSSVSIGVTTSRMRYHSAEDAIRDADTALYRAKASGKARYVMFDQTMHAQAVERLELENDLRQMVSANQLHVVYQPIISLKSRLPVGFEVLARWKHPTRGEIPPGVFIPLAEEIGMISTIGNFVLQQAVTQLRNWRNRAGFEQLFLSVNVSRKQLSLAESEGLLTLLRELIDSIRIDPALLKLEITESMIIQDQEHAECVLGKLAQLGLPLQIDDFGTGYSSLSCLHRFPISGLKIDRAFINHVGERHDYAAVVSAIVSLAHHLGIELVTEGVESGQQAEMLEALGCDLAQGFHFARPLALADAEDFIETHLSATPALIRLAPPPRLERTLQSEVA